jgi:hypothetical protein
VGRVRSLTTKVLLLMAAAVVVVLVALPYNTQAVVTTKTTCDATIPPVACRDRIGADRSVTSSANVAVRCGPAVLLALPPSYEVSRAGVGGTTTDVSVSNPCLPRNTLRIIAAGTLVGLGVVSVQRMRRGETPTRASTLGLAGVLLLFAVGIVPFQATSTAAVAAVGTPDDPTPAGYQITARTCTILGLEGDTTTSLSACEGAHGLPRTLLLAAIILVGGSAFLVTQAGEQRRSPVGDHQRRPSAR